MNAKKLLEGTTAGPWFMDAVFYVSSADWTLMQDCSLVPDLEAQANIRLAAAAPTLAWEHGELVGALQSLLEDLTDAEEDRNQETGEEYATGFAFLISCTAARALLARIKEEVIPNAPEEPLRQDPPRG